jgi:hypothetical protein
MEPVSAFALAAALIQVTEQAATVFTGLYSYFRFVKNAPKLSRELREEARLVSYVLEDLKTVFEEMDDEQPVSHSKNDNVVNVVKEFIAIMNEMESRVEVKAGERYKRVKWPFTQKENQEYLTKLERFKNTFELVLHTIEMYYSTANFLC